MFKELFSFYFFIYLTKHMCESLVAISKEAAGILEFRRLPFVNMRLNLKINSVNL